MKFLKKYNESNQFSEDIDNFLIKVKDELINITDEFEVDFEWEEFSNIELYKKYISEEYHFLLSESDEIPFYISVYVNLNNIKKGFVPRMISLLENKLECYKKVNHLINTSDIKFKVEEPSTKDMYQNVIKLITWYQ